MTVPPFLLDGLQTHVAEYRLDAPADGLLFVGPRSGILRRNFVERVLRPASERAGLPASLTFHGLRHIAVSSMAEAGVPYNVTQARAGHATARMTVELYSHRSNEADRAAAQALEGHFGNALRTDEPRG
jgi:integrase